MTDVIAYPIVDGRVAANQAAYRRVNELVQAHRADATATRTELAFLCECSRGDCNERIVLALEHYREMRRDPLRFAVAPGHEDLEFERVLERRERYSTVEKFEAP